MAQVVIHGTTGSTSYETIPPLVRLESSGGVLSTVDMVVQRRDDPRRLRDHDDEWHSLGHIQTISTLLQTQHNHANTSSLNSGCSS